MPAGTPPAPAAPTRPEYIPETHWDATANKVKDDKALGTYFNEIITRDAAEQSRRLSMPQTPDAYKNELPPDFKPPEGSDFKFNDTDPLLSQAKTLYHDIQTGKVTGQEGYSKLLALHAGAQLAREQNAAAIHTAEIAKLGPTGPARVTALDTIFKAHLGEEAGARLTQRMFFAEDVLTFEKFVTKFVSQGGATFRGTGREPPAAAGVKTPEQIAQMTPAQKLDYSRSFDQKAMPAWKDPRAA